MSLSITVGGGPPWGLRVSHDEELRPVVAKLIPCGRADSAGVRIGDHIEEVNGIPVSSPNQAHGLIQETKGELRLKVGRSSAGYHATVAREKLSSSLHSSPVNDRKFFNSSVQPRTNPNFRQIRLDVQGVKGSADNKRRMFEQLSSGKPPPPATDRLLQRKIQMGFHAGLPSESTTGYGSVGGDFAGGSGRTTPMSSILAEEDEEADRTLHDDGLRLQNNGQGEGMHPNEMRIASPGPSQWAMRTESHSVAPADGSVEVPRPRGVAALRQAITEKLEMKSPSGASPTTEGRRTPSSWANVKVYEGIEEDPSKPVFGRVLDGPVNPEKYFQGVPPPSYNWVPHASSSHAPAPTSPVQSKPPPFVPPKPPKPSVDLSPEADINGNRKENGRNSFLNSMAAREVEESPSGSEDYGYRGNYYDNSYGRGSTLTEDSSMTRSTTATEVEQPADPASVEPPEDPTASLAPTNTWPTRGSMDLESSQLLKSKSPSPYSSSSADHYATIRRAPTPVQLEVTSPAAPAQKQYSSSTTNDSGYGDALSPRSTLAFDTFSTVSTMPASSADQTIDTLSIDSPRPERPESLLSYSTVEGGNEQEIAPLRPVSNDPEMTNWYRDMFKKMHRLDPVDPGRPHNGSPSAASTISRPLTPTTLVSRPPSRFECEITPRRARSVGRVVEPADRAAWERSRTVHFHLPSYAFRDEDPRAIVCGGGGCSANGCMRCGRPRKAPSWGEIDYLYRTLGSTVINKEANEERLQSRIARRAISDRLDETARELEIFIAQLSGQRHEKEESPAPSGLADEIAELKRISKEEMMVRQKAERLQEELEEQRQRRHGYLPSAAPALQKNTDRFEGLINDYSKEASPSRQMRTEANNVQTATAVYKFVPKSSREMPLNKGDVVRVHRQIDSNWLEGERNGRSGIFPASYVQMNSEADPRLRMKAVYPFTARNSNEMSLKLGEVITWRREIDANWAEGANHIGEIGIFPKCYVRPLEEDTEAPTVIPARPKTPKITFEMDRQEEEWKPKAREPVEHSVPVHVQQSTYQPAQPAYEPQHEPYQSRVHQPISQQPAYEPQSTYQPPLQHHISHQPEHEPYQPRVQPMALSQPAGRHPAFSEDEPVAIHGASNGYHSTRVEQGRVEQPQINGYHDRHEEFQTNSISATQPYQTGPSSQRPPSTVPTTPNAAGSSLASMIPKGSEVYRANFAYHPEKEDELELRIDDIIFVVEKCDDGWFIGTSLRNGRFGTFPGNYVVRH